MRRNQRPSRARLAAAIVLSAVALVGGAATPSAVQADTRELATPVAPDPAEPVTADVLPTVQTDGVVWDTTIIGDRVYAVGDFANARPAGSPPGVDETPRRNLLAFDLHTGELDTTWTPTLNAEGRTIEAAADGDRVYVGGHFTEVNGQPKNRLAAIDAQTGDLIDGWDTDVNSAVRAIVVSAGTVYIGGTFTAVDGIQRLRLAAVDDASGELLPWAPTADLQVDGLAYHEPSGRVIAAGRFGQLSGQDRKGSGTIDGTTGDIMPWAATEVVPNGGKSHLGISNVVVAGDVVYGAGWHYQAELPDGSIEGTFAADVLTGEVAWVNGCFGDTYDLAVGGDVLYTVGHEHDCGAIGTHFESAPRTLQFARAVDRRGSSVGRINEPGPFWRWFQQAGRPATDPLIWLPKFSMGTYTGKYQAGWTVEASGGFVVVGGEFPKVNDIPQQGLVRFATTGAGAPHTQRPLGYNELKPMFRALDDDRVRMEWTAAWDPDDELLTYELLRGPQIHDSEVVDSWTTASDPWQRIPMASLVTDAPPGEHRYRLRVTDAQGNQLVGPASTFTSPTVNPAPNRYHDRVVDAGAIHHWRLGESTGTVRDWIGADDFQISSDAQRGIDGAPLDDDNAAVSWPASSDTEAVRGVSRYWHTAPQAFSLELWFRTDTTSGGKLIGFGGRRTGRTDVDEEDRNVYMTDDGRLVFGVRPDFGDRRTIESSTGYNDGEWHHVVATLGDGGAALYLDGSQVALDPTLTGAQVNAGYWRLAGDRLTGWPDAPTHESFGGTLDEVAFYPFALPSTDVEANYEASDRGSEPEIASDTFDRVVSSGWGTAEIGGTWADAWPSGAFNAVDGAGHVVIDGAGKSRSSHLDGVSASDVEVTVDVSLDLAPTGGGTYVGIVGRRVSSGTDYLAKLRFLESGSVHLSIVRRVGYAESTLAWTPVSGVQVQPGDTVRVGFEILGQELRASVWPAGQDQRVQWQATATDSSPELRGHGAVGIWTYVAGSATGTPVTVTFDNLHAIDTSGHPSDI